MQHSHVGKLKRLNLISGKGGVGRSTLAASLAVQSARSGKRTLLAEIEDDDGFESPLAGIFGKPHFQNEPELIEPNLYVIKLSANYGQERFLNSFLKINKLTQTVMKSPGIRWFLEGAPAFKEMGFFNHLLLNLKKKEFESIVLDLPATGHLVGLARLPRILLKLIPIGPIADRLKEGQTYFYNPDHTAAWIVTLPEPMPVNEAIELRDALLSERVPVGGFILNRTPHVTLPHEFDLSRIPITSLRNRYLSFAEANARLQPVLVIPEVLDVKQGVIFA